MTFGGLCELGGDAGAGRLSNDAVLFVDQNVLLAAPFKGATCFTVR